MQHDVQHPVITYFKFILAGQQFGYPGFNGQFAAVNVKAGPGAFIDNLEQFNAF